MRPHIILDTDMDTDCDDAGALAVLHELHRRGECDIAAIICSLSFFECTGAVHAINAWYERSFIPVGRHVVEAYERSANWSRYREHREHYFNVSNGEPYNVKLTAKRSASDLISEDAVDLYRRILSAADDGSITICAIGTLTALADLLASPPDRFSDLDGATLVKQKVRELISMAVAPYSAGNERFNWGMDSPSAATVLEAWPTPVTVSAAGDGVMTGARFVATAPVEHPVRVAYTTFLAGENRNRPSWDLIAVLYAVRELNGPFALSGPHSIDFDAATANYRWGTATDHSNPRRLVIPIIDSTTMAETLENLLIDSLKRK